MSRVNVDSLIEGKHLPVKINHYGLVYIIKRLEGNSAIVIRESDGHVLQWHRRTLRLTGARVIQDGIDIATGKIGTITKIAELVGAAPTSRKRREEMLLLANQMLTHPED
jgi:hypothetical protein